MDTQHSDKKSQETNSSTHNVTNGPPFTLPPNKAWSDQIVQKTFSTSGGAIRTTRIRIVRTAATTPSNIPTALHEETVSSTFPHQPANEFPGNQVRNGLECSEIMIGIRRSMTLSIPKAKNVSD
jgi:hypothetical protein